jgi:M6 family metalloprotease-like protein
MTKLLLGVTAIGIIALGSTTLWRRRKDDTLPLPLFGSSFLLANKDVNEADHEELYLPFHVDTLCSKDGSLDGYNIASNPVTKATDLADRFLQWCRDHIIRSIPTQLETLEEDEEQPRRLRSTFSPNQGKVRALVLLLAFPEHTNRTLPTRDYFDRLCNQNISDYFHRQSYGQYQVSCDVMDWTTLPYSQELYANGLSNLVGHEYASDFFVPDVLNDQVPYDLSRYDANGDGAVDVVIALHSGYAAEYRRGHECGDDEPRHRFHSQGHVDSPVDTYGRNGTRLAGYAISSVFDFVCTNDPAGIGVIAHEWMHVLRGLPDLYDPSTGRVGGVAAFDIMAAVKGPVWGLGPSSLTAYSKIRAGWMEATEIVYNGLYTVLPLSTHPQAYIIRQGFAEQEYLLIENRPAVNDDVNLFGGGLLVYHVDDAKRVQGTVKDWPALGKDHYKVAVVQADGRYDIERGINNGDADDFWKADSVLDAPVTDSYVNGPTGISVKVVSYQTEDHTIVIQVSGLIDDLEARPSTISSPAAITRTPATRPVQQPDTHFPTSGGLSTKPSTESSSFPTTTTTTISSASPIFGPPSARPTTTYTANAKGVTTSPAPSAAATPVNGLVVGTTRPAWAAEVAVPSLFPSQLPAVVEMPSSSSSAPIRTNLISTFIIIFAAIFI